MIKHGEPPYLECSTRGDVRFSAYCARVPAYGNKTIEEIYQGSKVFANGQKNLPIKLAKGRRAINAIACAKLYSELWDAYIAAHPELIEVLRAATGLSDKFGQEGHVCQATELWRIRNAPCDLCSSFDFRCTGACRDPGRPVPPHGSGPGGPAWELPQ
jgi:hypothetical protein